MRGLEGWSGVPLKYSLPVAVGIAAITVGGVGEATDIAYHVDFGRDESLLTPPHLLILLGIGGIALAGLLSLLVPGPAAPGSLSLRGRTLPPGGLVILLCSGLALAAFPLDGTWHALFGEDLTLWSPTHLLLIGGPTLSLLGMLLLARQGSSLGRPRAPARAAQVVIPGLLLVALADLGSEFAFGVPQFRLLFHPLVVALAGGFALVLARVLLGRYAALKALAVYLALSALPLLGLLADGDRTLDRAPLFVVEAVVVELVALRRFRNPLSLGAAAGLGVGTLGLAAEWGWSQVWMPYPWTASLLPEAILLAAAVGAAAGLLGARVAAALSGRRPERVAGRLSPAAATAGALALLVAAFAVPLPREGTATRATVVPYDTGQGATRLRVALDPPDAAEDAEWFRVAVFHGGSTEQVELRSTGPGSYETERALPVSPERDASLRLARGRSLASLMVYSQGDEHGDEPTPLAARTSRLETEHPLPPVGGWREDLQKVGYAVVALIAALWLLLLSRALTAAEGGPMVPRRLRGAG